MHVNSQVISVGAGEDQLRIHYEYEADLINRNLPNDELHQNKKVIIPSLDGFIVDFDILVNGQPLSCNCQVFEKVFDFMSGAKFWQDRMLNLKRDENSFIARCSLFESASEFKTMVETEAATYVKTESLVSQDDILLFGLGKIIFHIDISLNNVEHALERLYTYLDYSMWSMFLSLEEAAPFVFSVQGRRLLCEQYPFHKTILDTMYKGADDMKRTELFLCLLYQLSTFVSNEKSVGYLMKNKRG